MSGCLTLACLVAIGLLGWTWAIGILAEQAQVREERHRQWGRKVIAATEAVTDGDRQDKRRQ